MKIAFYTIILLFFSCSLTAQIKSDTVHIKKPEKDLVIKPCICGQSDTVVLTKKQVFMDGNTIDLCKGKKILKTKVISFEAEMFQVFDGGKTGNKLFFEKNEDRGPVMSAPPYRHVDIKNVTYYSSAGTTTLNSPLIIILKD